jgi:hypothetical protein
MQHLSSAADLATAPTLLGAHLPVVLTDSDREHLETEKALDSAGVGAVVEEVRRCPDPRWRRRTDLTVRTPDLTRAVAVGLGELDRRSLPVAFLRGVDAIPEKGTLFGGVGTVCHQFVFARRAEPFPAGRFNWADRLAPD